MNFTPEIILLLVLVALGFFAAGAGSGTFLGKIWAKATAWDAQEAAKIKAAVTHDEGLAKAAWEITVSRLKAMEAEIEARAAADALPKPPAVTAAPIPAAVHPAGTAAGS